MSNKLITEHLRKIAQEQSEGITVLGETSIVTKAEALARILWKMTLGFEAEEKLANGQLVMKKHSPDKTAMCIILDRLEGRISQTPTGRDEPPDMPRELTESGKDNITKAGKTVE